METTAKYLHCNPVGIAINSIIPLYFNALAPHRAKSRALESIRGFGAAPAPRSCYAA